MVSKSCFEGAFDIDGGFEGVADGRPEGAVDEEGK